MLFHFKRGIRLGASPPALNAENAIKETNATRESAQETRSMIVVAVGGTKLMFVVAVGGTKGIMSVVAVGGTKSLSAWNSFSSIAMARDKTDMFFPS